MGKDRTVQSLKKNKREKLPKQEFGPSHISKHTSEISLRKLYWKVFNRFRNCTEISPIEFRFMKLHWMFPLHIRTDSSCHLMRHRFPPFSLRPIQIAFLLPPLSLPLIHKTDGPKGRRKIPTKWHFTRKKKREKVKLYVCVLRPTCNFIRVFFPPLDWCTKKLHRGKCSWVFLCTLDLISILVH